MEQQSKYIDSKTLLKKKEKISVTIPRYLYDDLTAYNELTGQNLTETVTTALLNFFRNKTLTNDYILGYGNLYFKIPTDSYTKENVIAEKEILNSAKTISEIKSNDNETIYIKNIPNNLDIFNGSTYSAGANLEENNIKHIGLEFAVIPTAIKPNETTNINKLDIDIINSLYCFYFEFDGNNKTNVYLINPIDAVNKLSSAKSNKTNESLINCLKELETIQETINNNYADEMQELFNNNSYVSNEKRIAIKDKYTALILELARDTAIKYNNSNIKFGSDAVYDSLDSITFKLNNMSERLSQDQEHIKNIIDYQEQKQK